jgi:carboxyl-terminal processing protease
MMRNFFPVKFLSLFLALLVPLSWGATPTDRKSFSSTPILAAEAQALIKLLEDQHYNSSAVRSVDYAQVVPDYMEDLDSQRLFFLATDLEQFGTRYGRNVYYNTAFLGNIDAAYEIYYVYQKRVEDRVAWILAELAKETDFTAKEAYETDRSKLPWPANPAAADDLWRRRLKYELIGELLNKKTPEEATAAVKKRYERMLKNVREMEGNDLAEIYLSAIARLFDPHSSYFSAETFDDFSIQMKLQLVGIGAQLVMEEDTCVVREIIPGGPADIGRELKANDKIVSVAQANGEPVDVIGMRLTKIVELIRGEKGTQVHLTVQPADSTDPAARKEIVITRDKVKLNSSRARAAVFQLPGADGVAQPIGVITLPAFYGPAEDGDTDAEKTTASMDVARLIARLKEEKIEGLVLDLRRNGGGYLNEAIELAGLFIKQGPVVQVKASDGGIEVANDQDEKIAYTGPLAVLVDRFSASASEIVAGALQNYGRAIIVGDNSTHGKGSVQTILEMRRLSPTLFRTKAKTGAAKFTIQKYYLPSGASTQLKGVVPDLVLPSVDEFIPNIGEASLPRAMVWDKIPTSFFDGEPLEPAVLTPLREASLKRQAESEDFVYLKKSVERFKARQEMKAISVNLDERQQLKADDDAFRKEMRAERARIAESDFPFQPFYLGPPPPPKTKPPKRDGEEDPDFDPTENETYTKADVHLRETLRVVRDAINLGREPKRWANNRAPLTATGG